MKIPFLWFIYKLLLLTLIKSTNINIDSAEVICNYYEVFNFYNLII